MTEESFKNREVERANRLAEFVKAESRNMWVEARFALVIDLFNYFAPEIEELLRKKIIEAPRDR